MTNRSSILDNLSGPKSATTRRALLQRAAAAGIAAPLIKFGTAGAQEATPQASPQADVPQGGTMVVMGHQEVSGLTPEIDATVPFIAIAQIHDGLYNLDETFTFQPALAESQEISEDGLTYTFTLRQDVLFHDGEPFTSEDIKYTFDWIKDPANASTRASAFETVASVETPDDFTVVVTLSEANASALALWGGTMIYPAHYHAEVGEEAYSAEPIGTGPFRLESWDPAASTLLVAFDDHFRGRPNMDAFRLDVVPEPASRAAALETGEADSSIWPLIVEDSIRLAENEEMFTTYITLQSAVNHFPLNNQHPILSDVRVRKAMMHAIDRQALIDNIFAGEAVLATAHLSPLAEVYYISEVTQYPYDVEAANALLDEAGWVMGDDGIRERDGEPLTFTCVTITDDQARRPEAELAQQYLREVGIDMQLQEAPVATILEQMVAGEMDASLFNWVYGNAVDPNALDTLGSEGANNFSNYRNERVDELLRAGQVELDQDARVQIYQEIQQIVAEEVPFLFIMHWQGYHLYNNRIQGLPDPATVLSGDTVYRKAYSFWIEE